MDHIRGGVGWEIRDGVSGLAIPNGFYPDSHKQEAISHAKWLSERHFIESETHKNRARNWW